MKKTALYSLITAASLLMAGTVYGASNTAWSGLMDVSSEGQNIASFKNVSVTPENDRIDSQMADSKDMQDTTSNYGIAQEWGNTKDEESWYDLNILGR